MKKYLIFFFLLFLILLSPVKTIFAKTDPEPVVVKETETFEGDYFKAAEDLVFSGKVKGDLFLAGGMVTFDGETTGDLFIAGGKVTIKGKIGQNLRAAGGQLTLGATIGRNALILGGSSELDEKTTINGSLICLAGNTDNNAKVNSSGNIVTGRLYQNGSFGQKLNLIANQIVFGQKGFIADDLHYKSLKELSAEDQKLVKGKTLFTQMTELENQPWGRLSQQKVDWQNLPSQGIKRAFKSISLFFRISWLAIGFIFGFLFLRLFSNFSLKISQIFQESFGKNILYGIAYGFFLVLAFILLAVSLIGIPFLPVLALIAGIVHFLTKILGPFSVGRLVLLNLTQKERRGWALLLGLVISFVASFVPFLGRIYGLILTLAATGSLVNYLWQKK